MKFLGRQLWDHKCRLINHYLYTHTYTINQCCIDKQIETDLKSPLRIVLVRNLQEELEEEL